MIFPPSPSNSHTRPGLPRQASEPPGCRDGPVGRPGRRAWPGTVALPANAVDAASFIAARDRPGKFRAATLAARQEILGDNGISRDDAQPRGSRMADSELGRRTAAAAIGVGAVAWA